MSTTPKPRGRRSSRGSDMSETFTPVGDTTLTGLQRLPIHTRYPLTPSRLAVSGTPSRRTPRNRATAAPSTPYGLRAIQRRAANTPARDRRKSGRMQRETTFDILRNLGRALAPVSQPIRSSPQEEKQEPELEPEKDEIEELDNEPEIERPRLSLPLEDVEEQEEASPEPRPPRLSLAFEEEDITVEYPRRATSEHDRARLSMMSFGNPRLSENFGDATRLESDSEDGDDTGIEHGEDRENQDETVMSQGAFDRGGETEDLGRFNFDFNFPSPPPPPADGMDGPLNDDEGFELPPVDLAQDAAPMSDDSDDAAVTAGEFGLDLHMPSRVSLSESPGIVGGGLRDEDTVIVQGKQKKLSRHGIPVPNMPSGVIRKLATRFAPARAGSKAKISKATLAAIEQASSWYFEQVAEDLAAYSKHAGRKTIDESDVIALMRRQRHINDSTTVFSLASKHLPKELLQDMRLSMPP
ncbi:centromere kinetochore component CENP-T-domain-containing protein [Aspergillus pseudocaelatus]|uniref:Centromere kinetochore component CENP-T-domain-containing protein n=1 Tax=Aspergillus pseudocaelatus TaxID=1825620 RepID=A0ABQ6WGP4_9EURO|nr:centromere kinetochore component CENP-T-domain-containing protein [Aspergillus pseudocaelatus]